jgi:DNA-binding SARP family transcriptional activator
MPAVRLYLRLLGLFRLLQGDQLVAGLHQARLQHLLAYLALHRAAPISRQQLAFLFWPDFMDQQALKNFRTLLTRLGHALPGADHCIAVKARTIQWRPDAPLTLDVAEFEAIVAQAAAAQARGEYAAAASLLAAAIATYTGELLPDCHDDWILPLRKWLGQAYGDALERLVLLLEEQRDYGRAITYAQRLLQHDPLHGPAYQHLMRLHLLLGGRTDANGQVLHQCVPQQ